MKNQQQFLFISGSLATVVGIALVVWGIRKRREEIRDLDLGVSAQKPEVFAVFNQKKKGGKEETGWPSDQVNVVAAEFDGHVATAEQLIRAKDAGAEWHRPTWVSTVGGSDEMYLAAWPVSSLSLSLSRTKTDEEDVSSSNPDRVNYTTSPKDGLAGVAVYGLKPPKESLRKRGYDILPFNVVTHTWSQYDA
jgi:hypothetical protein